MPRKAFIQPSSGILTFQIMRVAGMVKIAFFFSPFRSASTIWNCPPAGFFTAVSKVAMRSIDGPRLLRLNSHQPAMTRIRTTTAVRTARFPFITSLPLHCPGAEKTSQFITICGVLSPPRAFPDPPRALDGFALVVRLLALRQPERDLDVPVLEVHPSRHERHPALDGPPDQLPDLLSVEQELALAGGRVIGYPRWL
jgi:hypothetical protein